MWSGFYATAKNLYFFLRNFQEKQGSIHKSKITEISIKPPELWTINNKIVLWDLYIARRVALCIENTGKIIPPESKHSRQSFPINPNTTNQILVHKPPSRQTHLGCEKTDFFFPFFFPFWQQNTQQLIFFTCPGCFHSPDVLFVSITASQLS